MLAAMRMRVMPASVAVALCLCALPAPAMESLRVQSGGRDRQYELYVPASAEGKSAPVVVLLHGSYGRGRDMARLWKPLADREGIVLVAPSALDHRAWQLSVDSPRLFYDILENVAGRQPIDRRRVYLFGQSGGAVYALILSMMESEYFAAVAIHGGAWRERADFTALGFAIRKIPVAMFVGDIDEFFPVRSARETERALREAGHPATLTVIPRHGHGYRPVAGQVNAAAWELFRSVTLESEPRFAVY
jgi:poly(3-hydroxybutyrate) depolymerase